MVRPQKLRKIGCTPESRYFKPRATPLSELIEVVLPHDELEAIRLLDLEGLYQEEAAEKMGVSRPTIGRILARARKTIADALINGKAIKIEGGKIATNQMPPDFPRSRGRHRRGGRK
ncbi:MAG TPA: DUF134 domain-containing protein [bacterium]|nr:DUF134 domain-containing protein [Myxococcales bacterium]OQA62141.1 MAG: hypothetical protein BWY40_00180 [bacterium ADurb.Bin270]HPW45977.1 DUF134 domain-containing protein [bacterium]HQC50267.1 DUF134 domain-containing protein [bacterium]HQG14000.1 DUF134 domain-containing protein [bacterium]